MPIRKQYLVYHPKYTRYNVQLVMRRRWPRGVPLFVINSHFETSNKQQAVAVYNRLPRGAKLSSVHWGGVPKRRYTILRRVK